MGGEAEGSAIRMSSIYQAAVWYERSFRLMTCRDQSYIASFPHIAASFRNESPSLLPGRERVLTVRDNEQEMDSIERRVTPKKWMDKAIVFDRAP
jgi:hypothetical protein